MLRATLVLVITIFGISLNLLNPFYGLILYNWYSFATPLELTYGILEDTKLSLIVALSFIFSTAIYKRKLVHNCFLTWLVVLFIVHVATSLALQGQYSLASILSSTEYLNKVAIIAIVSPVVLINYKDLRYFVLAICFTIGFLAFYYGIFGLFAGSRFIAGVGKMGDNNFYATTLVTCLPLFLGLLFSFKNIFIRAAIILGIVGILVATVLTFSRGGLIGLAVVLVLFVLKIRKAILIPGLVLVFVFGYYLYSERYIVSLNEYSFKRDFQSDDTVSETADMYTARMLTLFENPEETTSAKSRIHFWNVAWEMTKSNPMIGVGLNHFRDFYDDYDFSNGEHGPARSVHSSYFLVMSETGIIGFVLFLSIIITCFYYYFVFIFKSKKNNLDKIDRSIITYLPISLAGFLVCSAFVVTIYMEIFWLLVTLAIASQQFSKKLDLEIQQVENQ